MGLNGLAAPAYVMPKVPFAVFDFFFFDTLFAFCD